MAKATPKDGTGRAGRPPETPEQKAERLARLTAPAEVVGAPPAGGTRGAPSVWPGRIRQAAEDHPGQWVRWPIGKSVTVSGGLKKRAEALYPDGAWDVQSAMVDTVRYQYLRFTPR